MKMFVWLLGIGLSATAFADNKFEDKQAIERATRYYIESQHKANPELMAKSLHEKLKKRTYWKTAQKNEGVLETDYETMLKVAENYNKNNDKFPANPRMDITILDMDQRVASVKLSTDEWIDYMHLYKDEKDQWKIINVLWQYHDTKKHYNK